MPKEKSKQRNLADIIEEKIKEAELAQGLTSGGHLQSTREKLSSRLDTRIVNVYRQVGKLLQTYKSGMIIIIILLILSEREIGKYEKDMQTC